MSFKLENIALKNSEPKTISAFCNLTTSDLPISIIGLGSGGSNNSIIEFDTILSQENFEFVSVLPYIISTKYKGNYLVTWSFSCYLEPEQNPAMITASISTISSNIEILSTFSPTSTTNLTTVSFSGVVKLDGLNDGLVFYLKYLPFTSESPYMHIISNIVTAIRV